MKNQRFKIRTDKGSEACIIIIILNVWLNIYQVREVKSEYLMQVFIVNQYMFTVSCKFIGSAKLGEGCVIEIKEFY